VTNAPKRNIRKSGLAGLMLAVLAAISAVIGKGFDIHPFEVLSVWLIFLASVFGIVLTLGPKVYDWSYKIMDDRDGG
jgi:hypothetical protein